MYIGSSRIALRGVVELSDEEEEEEPDDDIADVDSPEVDDKLVGRSVVMLDVVDANGIEAIVFAKKKKNTISNLMCAFMILFRFLTCTGSSKCAR